MTAPSNVPRIPQCALCSGKNGSHDMDCPALAADAKDCGGLMDCPFCGADGEMVALGFERAIRCSNEHCPVRPETQPAQSDAEATAIWNTRP